MKNTEHFERKSEKHYKIISRWTFFLFIFLLCGCANKVDPITEINNGIQQSISELSEYAQNNMQMDADKKLLLQGAKDCAARADAMTRTYTVSMEKCSAEKSKLKLERNGLFGIVLILIFIIFRSPLKSVSKKLFGL